MTKMTHSSRMLAALLCLTIGNAIAEENTETQQAKPDVTNGSSTPNATNNQEKQSKPKEDSASTQPSQGSETKAAEPECNQ